MYTKAQLDGYPPANPGGVETEEIPLPKKDHVSQVEIQGTKQ